MGSIIFFALLIWFIVACCNGVAGSDLKRAAKAIFVCLAVFFSTGMLFMYFGK